MREIKFRAWFAHEMHDDLIIQSYAYKGYGAPLNEGIRDFLAHDDSSSPMVLMQYTGLKDKNGREIYEGDIVRTFLDHIDTVRYEYGGFWPFCIVGSECQDSPEDSEVIGNIYENPELLGA